MITNIMTKATIVSLFMLALNNVGLSAQGHTTLEREGKVFKAAKAASKSEPIATPFEYEDSKGERHTIYLSANGRAYCLIVSKNGNEYKKYLGEEVSKSICKEMGKEYKELKK